MTRNIRRQIPAILSDAIQAKIWSKEKSVVEGSLSGFERKRIAEVLPLADISCLRLYEFVGIESETIGSSIVQFDGLFEGNESEIYDPGLISLSDYLIIGDYGIDSPIAINIYSEDVIYFFRDRKDKKLYWDKARTDLPGLIELVSELANHRRYRL